MDKNKDLPRCDKCEYCIFGKSKKCEGYTEYCVITGRDVGQSHFGQNSPRTCPRRKAKTNQNKENNMQKRLKEIKPGEEKATKTEDITDLIKRWAEEKNLAQRSYDQHIYRLIQNISDLTRHIEEEDYDEAKHDLGYIYTKLIILAQKLSVTDDEDYTSFLINEIEAGRSIW